MHENVDHVSAVCEWSVSGMKNKNPASATVKLVRILGSHPNDSGSSPGGGILSLCVLGKHHRQLGSTLLDVIEVSAWGASVSPCLFTPGTCPRY